MSSLWLHPQNGFRFNFLLRDSAYAVCTHIRRLSPVPKPRDRLRRCWASVFSKVYPIAANTVKPVLSGHKRDPCYCPLNGGVRLVQVHFTGNNWRFCLIFFRLSFHNCKSCVYNCDDLLQVPSNSYFRSSNIWYSYIHSFIGANWVESSTTSIRESTHFGCIGHGCSSLPFTGL